MQKTASRTSTRTKTKHYIAHKPTIRRKHNGLALYHKLESIKKSLADVTDNVSDKSIHALSQTLKTANRKTKGIRRNVEGYVAKKPYRTVGFSVVVGLVIGYLMHNNRH